MSELFDGESSRSQTPTPRPSSGRSRALIITGFVVAIAFLLFTGFSSLWTEKLWYDSVDYSSVFTTQLWTRVSLFGAFAAVMGLSLALTIYLAYRFRPFVVPTSVQRDSLDRYREILTPMGRSLIVGVSGLIGVFAGSSASGEWRTYQLWRNGESFGRSDAYFGRDIGFYVFDLSWYHFLIDFAMAVTVICMIAAALVHYVYGGIRLQGPRHQRFSDAAQIQLSVLVASFVLFKAIDYYLSRFDLVSTGGGLVTGMTYTRDNAELPALNILMSIAAICAVLFVANVWFRTWLLPSVGLGLLLLSSILLGMLWPALVQRFQVEPTEADKEAPYIAKNIAATRTAYQIDDTKVESYAGTPTLEDEDLAKAAIDNPGIRLIDPKLVQQTFEQRQQVRGYYSVAPVLDVDRYEIEGRERDLVLGVRELNQGDLPEDANNWANLHTVYTHGYGVIAAYGDQRPAGDGPQVTGDEPAWAEKDIPPQGDLSDLGDGYEGRIYFGENSPDYSIVGKKSADATDIELDLPGGEDGDSAGDQTTTYDGEAGVSVGGLLNQVLYAMRFGDTNIVLSGRVHENSKILYDRNPRTMVEKVAPWLTVDEDPFPAVVDGRVVWILDGFTTTDRYPQAQRGSYRGMIQDALAPETPEFQALPSDDINYMRNAVKATVDAYSGQVKLYAWDEEDPILGTWMKAFPGTVLPKSAISAELLDHLRYPEDLFKVQRSMLAKYHVTDADDFYKQNDRWEVPKDPNEGTSLQPPYRLSVETPGGGDEPTFSLTSVYVPTKRSNLAAFLSVDADAAQSSYGTIRVQRLGSTSQIPGPGQIANTIGADEGVKQAVLPFTNNSGGTATYGNLLTLPVGGGLLYVQPIYTQRATGEGNYPVLRFVAASFGDRVGVGTTFSDAINGLLDIDPDQEPAEPEPDPEPGGTPEPEPSGTPQQQIATLLADADTLFKQADAALRKGDLATYQAKNKAAVAKVARALEISNRQPAAAGG
ncbi:MAG: UPF0182 family protein [Nocardioides sp.]